MKIIKVLVPLAILGLVGAVVATQMPRVEKPLRVDFGETC